MDRIPERLRTAAEGVAKATQMMAEAKSARNGDGACYSGLKPEETAEWQGAAMIENYEATLRAIADDKSVPEFVRTLASLTLGAYR